MTQLQAAIVAWAQEKLGVTEEPLGSNSGPEIDGWLHLVHLPPGEPWCAAFACSAALVAADEVGVALAMRMSGGTQQLWFVNIPFQVQTPQPGDIYVLRHSAGTGHCGIVETVDEDGVVATECSGNTFADKGGREGVTVGRHMGPPEKTHGGTLLGYLRVA